MKIDSHQHYWLYTETEFDWLRGPYANLQRDFLPADALPEMESLGYEQAIAVQARESMAENTFLLDLASRNPHIVGVVGWVDLRSELCDAQLEHFSANRKGKGVRHIAQGRPGYFSDPAFLAGIGRLARYSLTYDILVYADQLAEAVALVKQFPNQRFVLDHGGKPPIASNRRGEWASQIRRLAQHENVACKLSGLVTEADMRHWSEDSLRPYFGVLLKAFGPRRLMIGSDWPVCLAAGEYEKVMNSQEHLLSELSHSELEWVLGKSAAEFYRVD